MPEQLSMMSQLDAALLPPVRDFGENVRAHDPVTSFTAARMAKEFAGTQCLQILQVLRDRGPMSKDQIAARLRIDGVAVARRLADLQKQQQAVPTDEKRLSAAGRPERVWKAL